MYQPPLLRAPLQHCVASMQPTLCVPPQIEWMFTRKACLELTHNWGSEKDPDFKVHNGNDEPQG